MQSTLIKSECLPQLNDNSTNDNNHLSIDQNEKRTNRRKPNVTRRFQGVNDKRMELTTPELLNTQFANDQHDVNIHQNDDDEAVADLNQETINNNHQSTTIIEPRRDSVASTLSDKSSGCISNGSRFSEDDICAAKQNLNQPSHMKNEHLEDPEILSSILHRLLGNNNSSLADVLQNKIMLKIHENERNTPSPPTTSPPNTHEVKEIKKELETYPKLAAMLSGDSPKSLPRNYNSTNPPSRASPPRGRSRIGSDDLKNQTIAELLGNRRRSLIRSVEKEGLSKINVNEVLSSTGTTVGTVRKSTKRNAPVKSLTANKQLRMDRSSDTPCDSGSGSGSGGESSKKTTMDGVDLAYLERRRKNNDAAKRSRDLRRQKEDEIALRAAFLEQENLELRAKVELLRSELNNLHVILSMR
ncbi:hypothetical protein SNEBB_001822 [Seison nebaliae]|nr:hypothetical protein SNEBB_001822 [Seison nebaliae]